MENDMRHVATLALSLLIEKKNISEVDFNEAKLRCFEGISDLLNSKYETVIEEESETQ